MNSLYLWLQKEDNGKRLSEVYWNEQFKKNKLTKISEECSEWISILLDSPEWIDGLKKNVKIVFLENPPLPHIHAQYNPNKNEIVLYRKWIKSYSRFMNKKKAENVAIYHELYHIFEESQTIWYGDYSYKKREFLSEYFALEISRKMCGLEWSCPIYDLCIYIKDEEKTVRELERRLKNESTY